ncbi:hypothetical protein [Acetobacterium bakii]|uniref:Uncharacterized protein n=1 Tax=Acetobacterium bakii TaxID=52689 RepID=A0A0L6U549_9FIRM|nr:hypothetical protein [Acetobacterium bakii]KNZ43447.1 hypothetical protein AKG39_00635 [Acetobacterium bakii]
MILTKAYLKELQQRYQFEMDALLARYLLAEYEVEPFPHVYSEQDLYEQIRKLVDQYQQGSLNVQLKSPKQRLKERYETLQKIHLILLSENTALNEEISHLKKILSQSGLMEANEPFL